MCLWCQVMKDRRLLCEFEFVQIDQQPLILKMIEREVFLMKSKDQYHLSEQREWIYSAQSLKERRLLCGSMFIQLKNENSRNRCFSYETKASIHLSLQGEWI